LSFKGSAKKPGKDVGADVDKTLETRDRIRLMDEVKRHPPKPEYDKVELGEGAKNDGDEKKHTGLYAIDLHTLFNAQLSDRPSTVNPMIVDHAVRTAVSKRQAYRPEKRVLPFAYWWVIFMVIGIAGIAWLGLSMFGFI